MIDITKFKHFISLGHTCYIAKNLEEIGLRNASYPFDWVDSAFTGVEYAIKTHFEGFLSYENLRQHEEIPYLYFDEKYGFGMPHDFNKYKPLKKQLDGVKEKYRRRIDRFYETVSEPTLFFRYMANTDEVKYINDNYGSFLETLKSFCPDNEVVFISAMPDAGEYIDNDAITVFYVDADPDDKYGRCKNPLSGNKELSAMLADADVPERQQNLEFYRQKQQKKNAPVKVTLSYRIKRFYEKRILKEYKHDKQYK